MLQKYGGWICLLAKCHYRRTRADFPVASDFRVACLNRLSAKTFATFFRVSLFIRNFAQ